MADILIDSVSASFTGTDNDDTFRNGTGNLRDVTVQGLSGDDILSFGSAVQAGTGDGGKGLGYSIGSSTVELGTGQDTLTFSGQINSGSSKFNSTQFRLGADDDFALINGLASASGSVVKGNGGNDEITFLNASAGAATGTNFLLNGNGGDDIINVAWTGTETQSFRVLGGAGNDFVSGTFAVVSADAGAVTGQSGLVFKGNKGDDNLNLTIAGVSDAVKVNGNSGADTIVFTAAADISNVTIAGGKDADVISAVFAGANSSLGVSVQGNAGNDTASVTLNGGFVSGFVLGGGTGDDSLTLTNNVALSAGSLSVLAGTGGDTITLNVGGNMSVTGASGFVVDLGVAGVSAVSGGTDGLKGGLLDLNLSAAITGNAGAVFFRGSNSDDVIDVNSTTTGGGLSNATFSGESGADSITLSTQNLGVYSAVAFNGGAGADVFTANFALGTTLSNTAGAVSFNGEAGDDSFVANVASAGILTAAIFNGGTGADSFVVNVQTGAALGTQASGGTQFLGGSGSDTIGIIGSTAVTASTILRGGLGNDLITGTFASGGLTTAMTAAGGAGNDTISFVYSAAASAGITISGNLGGVIDGGAGTDSITVVSDAVTGGTFSFGSIIGGDGVDTITFGGGGHDGGGAAGAETLAVTGSVNAGAGADSIIFSGNNAVSAGVATFGGGRGNSAGFVIASGDTDVQGFDTVFVSNNDVTGGQAQQAGTFGGLGFLFSGYNDVAAGAFTMNVASAGVNAFGTTGGATFNGQALYRSDAIQTAGIAGAVVMTGGFIGATTAGALGLRSNAVAGTYILSGGSTLGAIFSSVGSVVTNRGEAAVFNVQNGSAGTVDGFLFVNGGNITDTIVKFETNARSGAATRAGNAFYFSAGIGNNLNSRLTQNTNSGGQIFFGANVGVG